LKDVTQKEERAREETEKGELWEDRDMWRNLDVR
jgi:hypothetical protein